MEVRSMMAADLVSSIWFQDVSGTDFERQGGGQSIDSTGVVEQSTSDPYVTDWIVQISSDVAASLTSVSQVGALLANSGMQVEVIRGLGLVGQLLVRTSDATAEEASQWFSSLDVISSFEQDIATVFNVTPNDPSYSSTWGMNKISAPQAWERTTGSDSVVVGVIDTGVDWTHPDLASNMWVNPGEIAGNGMDDDGNGFIDDVYGYDFVNNDGNPMDDNHHGTHVAGTIAAQGNNSRGVSGVAWNTSIMALKFLSASGAGYTSDAVRAINYATMMRTQYGVNIRVLNNSWGGGGFSSSLANAIQASNAADILFVAAAGNNGMNNDSSPHYPSNYTSPNIIAVAATDQNDNLASFSNYGSTTVDIAAPGVNIYSTVAGGYYSSFSGTSMAAPHVAGAAALAFALDPTATASEVRNALLDGADAIGGLTDRVATGGRLNVSAALELLSPTAPTPEPEPEPVPNIAPTLGSLDVDPGTIRLGETGSITITAHNVQDTDGSVTKVNFYLDSNGNGKWDAGDQLLGSDTTISGAAASLTFSNPFTSVGTARFFAQAVDNDGALSGLVSATAGIVQPDDHANQAAGATLLGLATTKTGKLNYAGDVDWFRLEVVAGKTYVLEATPASLSTAALTLYGSNGSSVVAQDSSGPESRIVWTATTTGSVYLEVKGSSASQTGTYEVRAAEASPFELENGNLRIVGTADRDSLLVRQVGSVLYVTLNGESSTYDASQVRNLSFDGAGGSDFARFFGTSARESWVLREGEMSVSGSGYTWSTFNTETNYAYAGKEDSVMLYDSAGNDRLTVSQFSTVMRGSGFRNRVYGSQSIQAISNAGGVDSATMYGTSGNDYFIAREDAGRLIGSGYRFSIDGFERTTVVSGGGYDQAFLYDSSGNDSFVSYGTTSTLSGPGYRNTVHGFSRVSAVAVYGGIDVATFYDTPGNDIYVARGNQAYMYGSGYFNVAQGFDQSTAVATRGGTDQAFFYDTIGDDSFTSRGTRSEMSGEGYKNAQRGFERVHAVANAGGNDVATLHDSAATDRLYASGAAVGLQSASSRTFITGFDTVRAISSSGSDTKYVGSLDFLMQFYGNWED